MNGVKSPYKNKHVCAADICFYHIFLNKIMVPIFQMIHIRNKTLDPCVKGGLEQRRKVQTRFQGLFIFWH